jgi:hypothetical protein
MLKWDGNEGHFTIEAETVFRPYHPTHWFGVTEKRHMELPAHALQAVQVRLIAVSNEGHFTLEAETFFVHISPLFAVGWLKYATWHSLRMRYVQCKLGWRRLVMKGTLL